jgi:hypothetical protein
MNPELAMPNTGTTILERLIMSDEPTLSADAARSILQLDFPARDHERVQKLSAKAQEGTLTKGERAELEEYIRVSDLLALLQSKARLSLKQNP